MLKLKEIKINKYKSYRTPQSVEINDNVTALVGKNESGKTAFLEALASVNYFEASSYFKLDLVDDYPRSEMKKFEKGADDAKAIECVFQVPDELINKINTELGAEVYKSKEVTFSMRYKGGNSWGGVDADEKAYVEHFLKDKEIEPENRTLFEGVTTVSGVVEVCQGKPEVPSLVAVNTAITERILNGSSDQWANRLAGYIARNYLKKEMPKFWYFDEYFTLPSRIDLNKLEEEEVVEIGGDGDLNEDTLRTAKALFEMAGIEIGELLRSNSFESFMAELEATSNEITDQMFKYWTTNKNLEIRFAIDTRESDGHKILDIRIHNQKHRVTIPLQNRSKGFNWFFSFLVWFSQIEEGDDQNFILLLDEPGLNLHAAAQGDLLRFIDDLSANYQVIYTTHSPFMIDSKHLERVRTVLDADDGTTISEVIQEKDPDTLFPLQAALGYDIAQNLYVAKNNLLVEGPADLVYLTLISNLLETNGRKGLKEGITIIPVGGLDKVSTFISLLRGNKLNIACLLDSFNNQKGKQKVDDLIRNKIIKEKNVRFFDEFATAGNRTADLEDLFDKGEYLTFFNEAFSEHSDISESDLDSSTVNITSQINKVIKKDRFNHYRPANTLAKKGVDIKSFSGDTLDRFEKVFTEINKLF